MMKTQIKEITPQWAAHILETRNPKNRNLNEAVAKSFAVEMQQGRWALTHQGIGFNENGDLIDGQHRLRGVVLAGRPIQMMVTTGIASSQKSGITYDTMDVVDRGRLRSIGQQLTLSHGWTCGGVAAAIARGICLFYAKDPRNVRLTTPQALSVIASCEASFRAIFVIGTRVPRRHNSKFAAACVIYHTVNPEAATAFYTSFVDQVGWTKDSPARALDRWRSNYPRETNGNHAIAVYAAACSLMAVHTGTPLQIVRVNDKATTWLFDLNPNLRKAVRKTLGI